MRRPIVFINGDFTLRENGSQIRMADQVDFMRNNFPGVGVYSHRQHPSHPWTPAARQRFATQFPDVELIVEDAPRHLRWATRLKNAAIALFPGRASTIMRWSVPGGPPRYREMRRKTGDYLFLVNFVDGYTVLNGFPFDSIIETHDIRFIKQAKRFDQPCYSLRIIGKMRSELAMLTQAGAAITISPVDAAVFGALIPTLRSFFIPNYSARPAFIDPTIAFTHDVLFVGANNNFNVDGITEFLSSSRDWLTHRTIRIAGRVCEAPAVRELADAWPNITLLGFVDDLAPVYASSRVAISPVEGTGLKIKVVEGLSYGKPILGSAHSRDALPPGHEGCVFPLDRSHLDVLLDDLTRLEHASRSAIEYFSKMTELGQLQDAKIYITDALSK